MQACRAVVPRPVERKEINRGFLFQMLEVSILCMTQAVGDCCSNEGSDHYDAHSNSTTFFLFFSKTFKRLKEVTGASFILTFQRFFGLAKDKTCLIFFLSLILHMFSKRGSLDISIFHLLNNYFIFTHTKEEKSEIGLKRNKKLALDSELAADTTIAVTQNKSLRSRKSCL